MVNFLAMKHPTPHWLKKTLILARPSLSRDFGKIVTAVCVGFVLLATLFTYDLFKHQTEEHVQNIKQAAERIAQTLTDDIAYVGHNMEYIYAQVQTHGADVHFIRDLLATFHIEHNVTSLPVAWNMFSWANALGKVTTDGSLGLLERPIDVNSRDYIAHTRKYPGKIFIGESVYGAVSRQWLIPAGMGVTDPRGQYLGSVIFGFDIANWLYRLQAIDTTPHIQFSLLDYRHRIVLSSPMLPHQQYQQLTPYSQPLPQTMSGLSLEPLNPNNHLIYVQKVGDYPLYIAATIEQTARWRIFWNAWAMRMAELTLVSLFLISVLLLLRQRIIRPMNLLVDTLQQMMQGQESVSFPKFRAHELQLLSEQLEKVSRHHESLEQAVKSRTEELQCALSVKDDLLNNVSHEVRTPLLGIYALSRGLLERWDQLADPDRYQYFIQVVQSSNRLLSLMNNLLDMSKFNSGVQHYEMSRIDLKNLVDEMIIEAKLLYLHDKQVQYEFRFEIEKGLDAHIIADEEKINQVLRNLVANAIKFMAKTGGEIHIKLESTKNNGLLFSICDEGPGIPEEEKKEIFKPFFQSTRTRKGGGGTGLGLGICQEITIAHHGEIWAENRPHGVGTCFYLRLPRTQPNYVEEETAIDTQESPNQIAPISNPAQTILVIDDESVVRSALRMYLNDYYVVEADGGVEGLNYIRDHTQEIAVVLLDMMMPDMYGLNVLEAIRNNPKTSHIKVILQSGLNDPKELEKAISLGTSGHIEKPYTAQQVRELVSIVMIEVTSSNTN
jgi:two-component system sensor histidine kinase ChiS